MIKIDNIFKRCLLFVLVFSLPFIMLGCSEYKENVPFFDELFFEYSIYGKSYLSYTVSSIDESNFKVIENNAFYKTDRGKTEMLVDSYGKVYKCRKKRYEGKFSPIWIPVHVMVIGDEFDDRNRVDRRDKWETWEVLVIKDGPTGAEVYYEVNTGFYVGESARGSKIILTRTNSEIPTID